MNKSDLTYRDKLRYEKEVALINNEPNFKKIPAEWWILVLMDYNNKVRINKSSTVSFFCNDYKISKATLYRKLSQYKKYGIKGLMPDYGKNRKSPIKIGGAFFVESPCLISLRTPMNSLIKITQYLLEKTVLTEAKKNTLSELLDHLNNIQLRKSRKRPISRVLTNEEMVLLNEYKHNIHRNIAKRALAVELIINNKSIREIQTKCSISKPTVYRYIKKLNKSGLSFIVTKNNPEKREEFIEDRKNKLAKIIHYQPSHYNINRTSWSLQTLADAYEIEYGEKLYTALISKTLRLMGYNYRKAKKVLTTDDPKYEEKVAIIKKVKMELKSEDAFYFVDEAGPWAVKKYGGTSLHAPGEIKSYPEFPHTRGSITFIAAYELSKKILLWKFINSKNSSAVIELLNIIADFTKHKKHVYLTWDSASWHDSKLLNKFVCSFNKGNITQFVILPLPSKAQYLNTIESYFSGLKRAIIANSDYKDKNEMKAAIERYFREKNLKNLKAFFKNPQQPKDIDFEYGMHKKIN